MLLLLLVAVSLLTVFASRAAQKRSAEVDASWALLGRTEVARRLMFDVAATYQAFFATGKPELQQRITQRLAALRTELKAGSEAPASEDLRKLRARADDRVDAWVDEFITPTIQLRAQVTAGKVQPQLLVATVGSDSSASYLADVEAMLDQVAGAERARLEELRAQMALTQTRLQALQLWGAGAALVLGLLLSVPLASSVGRRAGAVRQLLETVAREGELRLRLADQTPDELGEMGRALDGTLEGLEGAMSSLRSDGAGVGAAADSLLSVGGHLTAAASRLEDRAASAGSSLRAIGETAGVLSTGAREVDAAGGGIGHSAAEASRVAQQVGEEIARARGSVERLEVAGAQVGQVAKMIAGVANKTRLLSLNAQVEAARAGEAGRGFKVVAEEVKELSEATHKATAEVDRHVGAIAVEVRESVASLVRVAEVVGRIGQLQLEIELAVGAQQALARKMGGGATEVERLRSELEGALAVLGEASHETASDARATSQAAGELRALAGRLSQVAGRFHCRQDVTVNSSGAVGRDGVGVSHSPQGERHEPQSARRPSSAALFPSV